MADYSRENQSSWEGRKLVNLKSDEAITEERRSIYSPKTIKKYANGRVDDSKLIDNSLTPEAK